ncbi:hypothetical protein CLM83_28980, partial [Streptomyces albidoflavus]|uniref:hypothetical protein n=1 Tax=Streptomyces albidoflavus TaxID=1886 RepID=UPI000BC4D106
EVVKRIAESQVNIPERVTVHPRLLPNLQSRAAMVEDGTIDWGLGETLAIGSPPMDGTPGRPSSPAPACGPPARPACPARRRTA